MKSKRGLGNDKSAQEFADGQRIYHNFCRPHRGLPNGITPAQAARIDLNLGENKIKDLIEKSAEAKEEAKREHNIEVQLGKRIEHVNITREKDCTSVKPKKWINGFAWLENGKESGWIKMKRQGSITKEELSENTKQNLRTYGFFSSLLNSLLILSSLGIKILLLIH